MPTTEQLASALAGRYTIERQIGAGGMATVYLGHDVRHRRSVALKFLNPELGAVVGAERFSSEIELTAKLQHPHILPLFDSGEASLPGYTPGHGLLFYVMPYVDGETLRQRLLRERQLSVDEAVRITRAVASGLDYAHRHGVIHRDLKPENILLHEGEPLVADFGIALALSNAAGERITQSGISLGTPQYMSPEQAAGDRQLDARSDVYSLGTVLYEMLAGEPPHTGPTVQAVVSRVISEPPRPIEQLRHTVPDHVSSALERALAKVPADRFATAGEFAAALTVSSLLHQPTKRHIHQRRRRWIEWSSIAALGVAIGTGASRTLWAPAVRSDVPMVSTTAVRATIDLPVDAPAALGIDIPNIGYSSPLVALSPDGAWLVWVAGTSTGRLLYLRDMSTGEVTPLSGTEGAIFAFFSPDAEWIGFLTTDRVNKIPRDGGAVTVLCNAVAPVLAWWSSPESIFFTEFEASQLSRVSSDGGTPERLVTSGGAISDVLERGRFVLRTRQRGIGGDQSDVVLFDVEKQRRVKTLVRGGYAGRYVAPDHLIFSRAGALHRLRYDPTRQITSGAPVKVVGSVTVESMLGGVSHASLSANGVLAFLPGSDLSMGRPAWIERGGRVSYIDGIPERVYGAVDLSPSGDRLALVVSDVSDYLWIWNFARQEGRRVVYPHKERYPFWSRDGRYLAGLAIVNDSVPLPVIHQVGPDGSVGDGRVLAGTVGFVVAWTPGGDTLLLQVPTQNGSQRVNATRISGESTTVAFDGWMPAVSPDGRWVAHNSLQNGVVDVWLRAFPSGKVIGQVSPAGGLESRWTPSGSLFYRRGTTWWSTRVTVNGSARWEPPRQAFESADFIDTDGLSYAVANDGRRILVIKRTHPLVRSKIEIITNWPSLLDGKR